MTDKLNRTMPLQTTTYYPRELSWLAFNQRVLQEAADKKNPIIERIRFLGIYSSNMDEFYRVRVADVKRKIYIHLNEGDTQKADDTKLLMEKIQQRVLVMTKDFDRVYEDVVARLARYRIYLLDEKDLNPFHTQWLRDYFKNKILRHIAPILLDNKVKLVSRLNDSATYLYIGIYNEGKPTSYATIEVPTQVMSRFVVIPPEKSRKKKYIILLDNIIRQNLESIFKGFIKFDKLSAYSFKMTRDSEYSINDEIDESYVDKMSDSMKQRLIAEPVRVVYDGRMPEDMLKDLQKRLKISSFDSLIASGAYRNFKDFIGFPNIGREYLENPILPAMTATDFAKYDTVFEAITAKDILLYYPYHRFLHFTEFVRQAAFDPQVKHIRLNIYRVASKSRVMGSLIDAVDNGKKVTVVVELRARFDEQANIEWSKTMTDAGVKVVFGMPALKIHSKVCVVSREENGKLVNYAHLGTGNFNEKTAKIYTDFSLFTRNPEITEEAENLFTFIQQPYRRVKFQHLQVSPINARTKIQLLVRQEIQNCKEGQKAEIFLKLNNLDDELLIDDLYKASQAGVKVKAIIRGICSLIPGVKGLSENISIISIVDRFLEHPRVLVFENGGDRKVFISSADWMTRNMDNRIEVGCPIFDPDIKNRILNILNIQWHDTVKARVIDAEQTNKYVKRGNRKQTRSQVAIYDYLKGLETKQNAKSE
ncbi:MAG: polyphosphate kinase 1 [Paraglaciecola sp.]|uniref:polyphosphate kinase 1 n=1 Tax=Paraglaciecola sp. TaxID=1920173 RepID=UPI00273F6B3B|nr:polyphosphate kinase 1 [Paraglaciecola sp.]MDP5029330.1 polyphosphate kinase 1 [Paraglaciecola sp.]MDP5133445.1 polyphosphate kinase 1 [Paraglaciecola sp.]